MCQLISSIPLKQDDVEIEDAKPEAVKDDEPLGVEDEDEEESADSSAEEEDLDNEDFPEMKNSYKRAFAREKQALQELGNVSPFEAGSVSPEKQDQSSLEEIENISDEDISLSESEEDDEEIEIEQISEPLPPKTDEQQERERRSRSKSKSNETGGDENLSQKEAETPPSPDSSITQDNKNAGGDFNTQRESSSESDKKERSSKE